MFEWIIIVLAKSRPWSIDLSYPVCELFIFFFKGIIIIKGIIAEWMRQAFLKWPHVKRKSWN